jgi:hypothetical protein
MRPQALLVGLTILMPQLALAQSRPASPPATAPATPVARAAAKGEAIEEVEARPSTPGPERFWSSDYTQIDRVVNVLLPRTVRRGALVLVVDHRTVQPIQNNTWHDWFGFDAGGLKIGLGLRLGILENLDVGAYRLSHGSDRFAVYEFDARYRVLRQERHFLDVGLRAGVTWFEQSDAQDAVGGLGQLLLSRRLFQRLTLGTGLLFHSQSSNGVKSNLDDRWSMAVPLLVDVRILGWLTWNLELTFNVAGYGTRNKRDTTGGAISSFPDVASSVRFVTNRHTFALVMTNNPYCSADGLVANSPRGFDQLVVGFTIVREWNLW